MITDALYLRTKDVLAIGERDPDVTVSVPLTLDSRANRQVATRGARFAEAKRHKAQRNVAYLALCGPMARMEPSRGRLAVRLVRIAPRELDDDNLVASLKSVRDGVASVLRIDDRDPRVTWVCDQYRGRAKEHAVLIEVYRLPPASSPSAIVAHREVAIPGVVRATR